MRTLHTMIIVAAIAGFAVTGPALHAQGPANNVVVQPNITPNNFSSAQGGWLSVDLNITTANQCCIGGYAVFVFTANASGSFTMPGNANQPWIQPPGVVYNPFLSANIPPGGLPPGIFGIVIVAYDCWGRVLGVGMDTIVVAP